MNQVLTLYTPKEVADLLRVSERTVRRWIAAGKLPARRFGRQLRIPKEALDTFGESAKSGDRDWLTLATDSFAKDWENEKDAEYDRWREHYAIPKG